MELKNKWDRMFDVLGMNIQCQTCPTNRRSCSRSVAPCARCWHLVMPRWNTWASFTGRAVWVTYRLGADGLGVDGSRTMISSRSLLNPLTPPVVAGWMDSNILTWPDRV